MGIINVDEIKTGMVLAGDMETSSGRFLLAAGTVLTEKHLRVMKIWGVTEADVQGVDQNEAVLESGAELDPELLAAGEQYNRTRLFSLSDMDHPAVQEIFRLCARRTAQRMAAGWKPCEPGQAAQAADRDLEGDFGTAHSLIGGEGDLLSFSDIYHQITKVLNNPLSSSTHLADVVSKDPALAAKLLKLVNSPFYGFPSKIDSITRAITLVGSDELSTLALGISVVHKFQDLPGDVIDMETFWKHSICCGVLARLLATHKVGLPEERFFVAGLLHEVGQFILVKRFPKAMGRVFARCKAEDKPIHRMEKEILGYDHGAVAGALFKSWKFPEVLPDTARHHHAPKMERHFLESSLVHVADYLALTLRMDIGSDPYPVPPLMPEAWDELGLSPSILSQVVSQADRQVRHIYHVFLS